MVFKHFCIKYYLEDNYIKQLKVEQPRLEWLAKPKPQLGKGSLGPNLTLIVLYKLFHNSQKRIQHIAEENGQMELLAQLFS